MNTTVAEGVELARSIANGINEIPSDVTLITATPFTHIVPVAAVLNGTNVILSAQNCADQPKGAFTGEVSAEMLCDAGCRYTILGHSERREYYGETSETLVRKMNLALGCGLKVIFCCGEKLQERNAGRHFEVVKAQIEEVLFNFTAAQMDDVVIAYEPVWAIGTGVTATSDQAQEIHAFIREIIAGKFGAEVAGQMTILYGGSCKPSNAKELFACKDIDGGLIGGASLKAEDFLAIAKSY